MKLYEFSALVSVAIVIAAESRDVAEERIRSFSADGLVSGLGDVVEVSDIDFMEERELSSDDPYDEAHDVVVPQDTVEGAGEQRATGQS